ncbi:MAG: hydrogenase iron-sulfur subunit [Candidatus Freyarchaeota archaeon]|nr:hydrogenase iron-sulfur subunit [Candidatus Jordarchaeia archaeon]
MMATRHVEMVQDLLELMGVGAERVAVIYCSSAEGRYFAEVARKMSEKLRAIGSNPLKMWKADELGVESKQTSSDPPK